MTALNVGLLQTFGMKRISLIPFHQCMRPYRNILCFDKNVSNCIPRNGLGRASPQSCMKTTRCRSTDGHSLLLWQPKRWTNYSNTLQNFYQNIRTRSTKFLFSTSKLCHTVSLTLIGVKLFKPAKCDTSFGLPPSMSVYARDLSASKNGRPSLFRWLIINFIPLAVRAAQLLIVFIPFLITYPLTYVGPQWFESWLSVLYVAVEYSGATFIKLGQWASTRRDLFSPQVCDRFSGLHHQVKPHSWAHTARVLEETYGKGWQQILHLKKGQDPIGSGCIAQVYKGYLYRQDENQAQGDKGEPEQSLTIPGVLPGLTPVAIKVLHPGIQAKFERDMMLMTAAARALTWMIPKLHWINLNQCVAEFKVVMKAQLDMRQECRCLQKFASDFEPCKEIRVPKPIPHLTTQSVLIETFEEGVSIGEILKDDKQPVKLKEKLASIGVEAMLQMVFVNNFVHADLHPGNLLVQNVETFTTEQEQSEEETDSIDEVLALEGLILSRPLPKQNQANLRLVLLDCGITASLQPEDRGKFRDVFTAVVKGEGETVADLFLSQSVVNQCDDPDQFCKEMAQLVRDARQNFVSISKVKVAELLNSVFSVLSRHRIQLEANFATVVLAIAMLEGLGRSLNPNLDLLNRARPVLLGSLGSKNGA